MHLLRMKMPIAVPYNYFRSSVVNSSLADRYVPAYRALPLLLLDYPARALPYLHSLIHVFALPWEVSVEKVEE